MNLQLTTASVWNEIERNNFAVLGMVTAGHQARTVGIVYVVDDHRLYIGAGRDQWKTKHIAQNGDVSMTIPIAKRVPLMPWIKIPAATITLSGTAQILEDHQLDEALFEKLFRHDAERGGWCAIEVTPHGHFITYGIGVSLWAMRSPDRSRARVPVDAARPTDTEGPMTPSPSTQQANLDLVARVAALVGTGFADPDEDHFAPDFVFHFFNPHLPELDGDHHGFDGMRSLFERLRQTSDMGFHNEPHSLTPYGGELVVAYATNTVSFGGTPLDVDAIVVWRVVDGRVREAWDIPAINTVRPH